MKNKTICWVVSNATVIQRMVLDLPVFDVRSGVLDACWGGLTNRE